MNGTNEIWDELRSLSVTVAAVGRQMPYEVPEGYFNSFPGMVLERVAGWKDAKSLIYKVPEGYFDQFAQDVLARIKAGAGAVSGPLAGENAHSGGESDLADPVSAVLAQVGRATPYQVPEGYFEAMSPLLAVCREMNPYAVPDGYFESLSEVVTARTGQVTAGTAQANERTGSARVGKAVVRRMSWMKYSVAAVLAGLIITVGWLRWHAAGPVKPNVDLANLSKVSDAELQNFLTDQDTTLAQPLLNTTATIDMNDTDLKTLLGDVPDGELKQYMEEHGGASDIATN
jgi:hypothetical protein